MVAYNGSSSGINSGLMNTAIGGTASNQEQVELPPPYSSSTSSYNRPIIECSLEQHPTPVEGTPDVRIPTSSILHLLSTKRDKRIPLADVLQPVAQQAASGATWEAKEQQRIAIIQKETSIENLRKQLGTWAKEDALVRVMKIALVCSN